MLYKVIRSFKSDLTQGQVVRRSEDAPFVLVNDEHTATFPDWYRAINGFEDNELCGFQFCVLLRRVGAEGLETCLLDVVDM